MRTDTIRWCVVACHLEYNKTMIPIECHQKLRHLPLETALQAANDLNDSLNINQRLRTYSDNYYTLNVQTERNGNITTTTEVMHEGIRPNKCYVVEATNSGRCICQGNIYVKLSIPQPLTSNSPLYGDVPLYGILRRMAEKEELDKQTLNKVNSD